MSGEGKKSKSDSAPSKNAELRHAAKYCYEEGDYVEAKKLYERIVDANPEDVQTLCNLAKVLFQLGDFRAAKNAANRVLSLDATYEQAYHVAAKVAEKQGDLDKCEEILELGMDNCDDPYLLEDYYDEVIELKAEKEIQSSMKKKPHSKAPELRLNSENPFFRLEVPKKKPESKPPEPKKKVEKPSKPVAPSKPSVPDDCPDLVSDSDSESDAELPVINKVAKPVKAVSKMVSNDSFIQKDEFMKTVLTVAKEKNLTYEDVANNRIEKFKNLCKEGSEAYLQGVHRKSIEKYKEAYDLIDDLPLNLFKISEIDYAVLKYMLCLLRIQSANYENVVSAIQILQELEEKQARTLPSVYYLLGLAYQTLNRNKHALDVGEKGLSFLEKDIQFESQPYPQVYEIIPETRKKDLQTKLEELVNNCRIYRQPDAICRFSKCHSVNNHIIPSCNIYYSDPDFTGYVSAICEEHCKICFHLNCWRSWKEGIADGRKVTDKDVLGLSCFTEDCETDSKLHSKITQIDIIGTDGQVKSSVKSAVKNEKGAIKREKRTDSVSSEKPLAESGTKKEKRTEPATVEKPAPEPATAKEKVEKPAAAKKQKKAAEVAPVKTKIIKEVKDDNEDLVKIDTSFDITPKLNQLKKLREINFGYTNSSDLDPEKMDYGIDMDSSEPIDFGIMAPDKDSSCALEFILSMFYGFLRSEGPQKKSAVIRKWEEEKGDFDPNMYVQINYKGICELLLQSYHFCQVGSYIATSKQVHLAHKLQLADYENWKQKPVSESEDQISEDNWFGTNDCNANDLKSHPPDTFASAAGAKTKSTTPLSATSNKFIPKSEKEKESKTVNNNNINNNNNPVNNKNNKTNSQSIKNVNDSSKTSFNSAFPPLTKNPDENARNKSDSQAQKNVKVPETKKSKVNPPPEIIKEKKPAPPAPSPSRVKPGISRTKLSELIDLKFEKEEKKPEPEVKEFEEMNTRKIKPASASKVHVKKVEQDENGEVERKSTPLEERPNPFIKAIGKTEEDNEFECYNIKSTNAMLRSKLDINRNKNGLHTENTRRRRILDVINNHLESNVDVKGNEAVTDNKKYNFPDPKETVDLKQVISDEVVTSTNTQSPAPAREYSCQTNMTESKDIACQTAPAEKIYTESDVLLEVYKKEIEEWKEKNKNLELMLVESYNSNAELTEELDDLKVQFKQALEEKVVAIKIRNDTISELRETIEANEINGKAHNKEVVEQLRKAYKKSEMDLAELKKQLMEVSNNSKDSERVKELTEDLKAIEEFLLTVMKDYGQLLLTNFKAKATEKIEALDMAIGHCTDETSPSKAQILVVKKKWEETRSEISSRIREYKKKLGEQSKQILNGEKLEVLKELYTPVYTLPTVKEDLFDPIPALLSKLLEDVNKLAVILMQQVAPPQLQQMNLRNMLVDRKLLEGPILAARTPQQIFFPIYQQPMPPMQGYMPQQPRMPKPPPPFPVKEKKSRTPSESSTKSDVSFHSVSSNLSDISRDDSETSENSKISISKKKNKAAAGNKGKNNGSERGEATKGNSGASRSKSVTDNSSSSSTADKSSSLKKPVISNLTAMNSAVSSLKSSQGSASPMTLKLLTYLRKHVPNVTDVELEKCLNSIRKTHHGTLVNLGLETLAEKIREQLKLRPKNSNSLGYVKYTGPAWGTVKEEKIDWKKTEQGTLDCVICFEKLSSINYVQLACKHEFHETCIKKWFKEATVCPTCKRRCLLQDEYPPLK